MPEGRWGPADGLDSQDYEFQMEGETGVVSRPRSIVGHALTSPSQELSEALQYTDVELRGGKIVQIRRTKRPAQEIGKTYTIGFPSALMTPALLAAQQGRRTTFFLKYLCAEDSDFDHAYILPRATMNPPVEATDPITTADDATILTQTSEIQVERRLTLWALGHRKTITLEPVGAVAATSLYDIAYLSTPCASGGSVGGTAFAAVGGDGTITTGDTGFLSVTEDRFANHTDSTPADTIADVIHAVYNDGDLIVIADDGDAALAATSGSVQVSLDRGTTFSLATGISDPVYTINRLGSRLFAGGKGGTAVAAGPSGIHYSSNRGATWSEITSSVLNIAATILVDSALDLEKETLYFVGTTSTGPTGVLHAVKMSGSSPLVTDLTANLPTNTGLSAVAVLAADHLAVGGAGGFYAESVDGGETWTEISVGTTSAITGIAGTVYRTVVSAAAALYQRDVLTDYDFKLQAFEDGATVTGNFTKVRMGLEGDFNSFAAVTDDGEVVLSYPFYPGA